MNRHSILPALFAALLLTGCKGKDEKATLASPAPLVKVMAVSTGNVVGTQGYSGTIEETVGSSLSFSVAGTIKSIHVATGSRVSKGQLIATVDDATLRNSYDMAATTLRQATDAYNRMKQLHDAGSLPEIKWIEAQSQLEQAQSAERISKKNLADSRLYAPFSGVIAEKNAEVGQNALPGVPVVKLVQVAQVKVKIAVPENEISRFKNGQQLSVTVAALGGKSFQGRVTEIGVEANPMTRSYEVKALLANPSGELMPGMVCDVSTGHGNGQSDAIVLPAQLVQLDNSNRSFVWVNRSGKAHKVLVQTGALTDQGVVIASGLTAGDEVIVEGQQKVSEGMKIEVRR